MFSPTPFINNLDSSRDLTFFIVPFISSLEIVNVVKPDPNTYAAAVNPNAIKTFLANGLSTFPIKGSPVFNNGSGSLPKNPPDCTILM